MCFTNTTSTSNTVTSSKFCSLSFIVPPEKRTWMKYTLWHHPTVKMKTKNTKIERTKSIHPGQCFFWVIAVTIKPVKYHSYLCDLRCSCWCLPCSRKNHNKGR